MARLSEEGTRVFQQALALSDDERAVLVTELVATLPEPTEQADPDVDVTPAERAELERRLQAIERGEATFVPWPEARAQLEARLRAVRATRGR